MTPTILRTAREMRAWSRAQGQKRIGLVPTMGFLHEGHLDLVRDARGRVDRVVASVFVNPTQFGPNEDFARYPRDEAGDIAKLASVGTDAVFVPTPADLYPAGFDTYVVPETLSTGLCGASRPGHFRGVCTVVCLLFRITGCHLAVFGEKDYQQLAVVKRMARDLWLDVEVIGHPIVRDGDGLAMSSRNIYLSPDERSTALALSRTLFAMRDAHAAGEHDVAKLVSLGRSHLGDVRLDYLEIVDSESLTHMARLDGSGRALIAAFVGKTRLIDNVAL